jgi:hypothetical protein
MSEEDLRKWERKNKRYSPALSLLENESSEEEKKDQRKKKKKLELEIESWRSFASALRLEDRQLLNRMLEKIWPFTEMVEESKEGYETEAFLLGLLILQQKTINRLEEILAKKDNGS